MPHTVWKTHGKFPRLTTKFVKATASTNWPERPVHGSNSMCWPIKWHRMIFEPKQCLVNTGLANFASLTQNPSYHSREHPTVQISNTAIKWKQTARERRVREFYLKSISRIALQLAKLFKAEVHCEERSVKSLHRWNRQEASFSAFIMWSSYGKAEK